MTLTASTFSLSLVAFVLMYHESGQSAFFHKPKARQDRGRRDETEASRGNNHEARQDRSQTLKHQGEAEAASFLLRGCLKARLLPRDTHY